VLLTIDIGNSRTVAGVFAAGTGPKAEPDPLWAWPADASVDAEKLQQTLADRPIRRVYIASVVPVATRLWQAAVRDVLNTTPVVIGAEHGELVGLTPQVAATVGADRIANAVAARTLYGRNCIVVDFGTATNLDIVRQGQFVGGAISPGLEISAAALFATAARLQPVQLAVPESVVGHDTTTAIQAGLLYGEAGKVDALVRATMQELNMNALMTTVIATGGLSPLMEPLCRQVNCLDPNLTLKGLHHLAQAPSR
jgi:type III pantothenate kinase